MARAKGQVREGLRYVWSTPDLQVPLISMAIVGVFAFNFTVTLPLLAKFTFHGGAGLYSWFLVAMGAGAVAGGLATAFRSRPSTRLLACIGLVFGGAILAVALAPTEAWAIALLVPMGAASISFVATNNATLQLRADPSMRGRVMSLNAIAFLGSTPIGAPCSATSAMSPTRGWRWSRRRGHAGGQHPALRPRGPPAADGTEGLVMATTGDEWGSAADAPTNVVPLPIVGAAMERRERRSS